MATKFTAALDSFSKGELIEYVELFKAMAEGRMLQINTSLVSYVPNWQDAKEVSFAFEPAKYRVKKEPKVYIVERDLFAHESSAELGWHFYSPHQSGYSEEIPGPAKLYHVELKLTEIIRG